MYACLLPTSGFVEPIPATPKYQGVSRRKTSSERVIDDAWERGDLSDTMEAIVDHVSHKYIQRAPYLAQGDLNWPLADAVAFNVLRSLPGYDGPAEKLTPFDETRVPLSSYCNLIAKCRHLDLTREHTAIKEHEVLACELLRAGDDYNAVTHISDAQQAHPEGADRHGAYSQGQRYPIHSPEALCIVGQAISRLSVTERSIIRTGETGKEFRRVERRLRRMGLGWHGRSRKYDMGVIRRTVNDAGGLLAVYEGFIQRPLPRTPRSPSDIENSGFDYFFPNE